MSQQEAPRTYAVAIMMRMIGALAVYAVGIMVLLLSADAPITAISVAGLVVSSAILGQWWRTLHADSAGNNKFAHAGLILATIGFTGALFATVGDMDLALSGSSFVFAGAGMCLGAVRS